MQGYINSFQSLGAVDGPGIRFVIFMQGCPLRCVYCHNPETWELSGKLYSIEEVIDKVSRYKSYFSDQGGITISGGEPLMQWEFVLELLKAFKQMGIHTALDTSGISFHQGIEEILNYTDLVLCDLKFTSNEDYEYYTKGKLTNVLAFLDLTRRLNVPVWIRHVIVEQLTDGKKHLQKLGTLIKRYDNVEKVQLLPFKNLCVTKYQEKGIKFPLKDMPSYDNDKIKELYQYL